MKTHTKPLLPTTSNLKTNSNTHIGAISAIQLTHYSKAKLRNLVIELANEMPGMGLVEQIAEARNAAIELGKTSPDFSKVMDLLNSDQVDALYIEGLPAFNGNTATTLYRTMSLVLGCSLGEPFQYKQQHGGKIIPVLVPLADSEENTNSSMSEFLGHTDDAFIPDSFRVRHIALLGERNDSRTPTGYAPVEDILSHLTDEDVEILKRHWFRFRLPVSFERETMKDIWSPNQSIFSTSSDGSIIVRSPTYGTKVSDFANHAQATKAFESFKKAVASSMQWVVIERSTFFVLKNDRGLHARGQISTGAGSRRVYRTYLHNDLDKMRKATNTTGNVFDLTKLLAYFERNKIVHYS